MNSLLKILFCFIVVITSVRSDADSDLDLVYTQQKALGGRVQIFTNKKELETHFLKVINATFFAGCSNYKKFINSKSISRYFHKKELNQYQNMLLFHVLSLNVCPFVTFFFIWSEFQIWKIRLKLWCQRRLLQLKEPTPKWREHLNWKWFQTRLSEIYWNSCVLLWMLHAAINSY